jgi:Kef-type K+ transport system membrane component KefB
MNFWRKTWDRANEVGLCVIFFLTGVWCLILLGKEGIDYNANLYGGIICIIISSFILWRIYKNKKLK